MGKKKSSKQRTRREAKNFSPNQIELNSKKKVKPNRRKLAH